MLRCAADAALRTTVEQPLRVCERRPYCRKEKPPSNPQILRKRLFLNPATGFPERAVTVVEKVLVDQVPMLVAAGFFPPRRAGPR